LLYDYAASEPSRREPDGLGGVGTFTYAFEIAGRRFRVDGSPTRFWDGRSGWTPTLIFGMGLVGTLALVAYLAWQSSVNRRMRRAVEARERAEARQAGFGRMLDESHDEIYIFDATTLRFVHVTQGARRNLGYSMDELRAMTPLEVNPELTPRVFAQLLQPLRDGSRRKVVLTTTHRRRNGTDYDVETHLQLSSFDEAPVFIAIVVDVTGRKRIEERLRRSQRLEALGTVAGGVAHDFNNLLMAIMGYAELSQAHASPGSRLQTNLSEITRASERARDVVKRILTFSRQHPLESRPVDLCELVSETLQLMRASLPTTVEIHERLDAGCRVAGDPSQLHQVLMNLCTNAGHAMRRGGGVLSVRLESVELGAADESGLGQRAPGRYARITVRDTGHGISPDVAEHVFDPFYTTKGPGEGSGMGLAVAHGIVTGHGGAITVTSEVGRGTTFEVLLPEASAVESVETVPVTSTQRGSETILLVDDEPALVGMLTETLRRHGYSVEAFVDAEEALQRFGERPDRFDLVVTDQTMPKMTGTTLTRRVRDLAPELPVILVSGYGELLDEETIREAGVSAMLAKPHRTHQLELLIRELLDCAARQRATLREEPTQALAAGLAVGGPRTADPSLVAQDVDADTPPATTGTDVE
jgi:PAS domain S-box-containing protein